MAGEAGAAAERELRRRFDEALPGVAAEAGGETAVEAFVQLWRDVRQRLLEPLRTAVRALFCYMRLSEAQSGVTMPLRLLKHGAELQYEVTPTVTLTLTRLLLKHGAKLQDKVPT